MSKLKSLIRNPFSQATILVAICLTLLAITGWRSSGNSTKKTEPRVTNQTTAFELVQTQMVNDEFRVTLRNISEKTINGYSLGWNGGLIQSDYTIGNFAVVPNQIEELTFPLASHAVTPEMEIQAVVFTDRSYNGSLTAVTSILQRRAGIKTQLEAVEKLLTTALESSENNLAAILNQLKSDVASLPEKQQKSEGRAVRNGLHDAKGDVLNMLEDVIKKHRREKNLDLRQKLGELRWQVTERINRL